MQGVHAVLHAMMQIDAIGAGKTVLNRQAGEGWDWRGSQVTTH